jgi:hypothetical protein
MKKDRGPIPPPAPDQTYYFTEIVRLGWLGSFSPIACKRILTERSGILKPQYNGTGRSTRIIIKGSNLLAYQKKHV